MQINQHMLCIVIAPPHRHPPHLVDDLQNEGLVGVDVGVLNDRMDTLQRLHYERPHGVI